MTLLILFSSIVLSVSVLIPLGVKWELDRKVTLPAAIIVGMLSGMIVSTIILFWDLDLPRIIILELLLIGAMSISSLLWRFYRDPTRIPPEGIDIILSPADGKVIYVKKIEEGEIPFSEKNGKKFSLVEFIEADVLSRSGYLIGISMNFLDVHVNRAPVAGRVSLLKHIKGLFISLKKKEAILQNERVLTVFDNGEFKIGVIQIASRLVRKIVPFVTEGQVVKKGDRIGAIRLGSQVDLILPDIPFLNIKVIPETEVKAGITILADAKK